MFFHLAETGKKLPEAGLERQGISISHSTNPVFFNDETCGGMAAGDIRRA